MQVKKPATYREQVEALQKKGLLVENERQCEQFLHRVTYYRFSAYLYPFRQTADRHIENVTFERVRQTYEFDRELRALLLQVVEEIELMLRSQISYYHVHKYGELGYMREDCFNRNHRHRQFLRLVEDVVEDNKTDAIVRHHRDKYDGLFPLWVVIDFFSIGMLSYFYADLLPQDKKALAGQLYQTTPQHLESWLHCLTDLRNRCAHYARLYFWNFVSLPKLPKGLKWEMTHKLFDQLLALQFLYPDRQQWNRHFMPQLKALLAAYAEDIELEHIGFPPDWESRLQSD